MLRDDAGMARKRLQSADMLSLLNIDGDQGFIEPPNRPKKIKNVSEILNVLSSI
jgi:hypothetical protein